jgi:hypothetical protein
MSSPNFLCSICFKPIISNDYQIDERGWAVHKKCYEQRALHTALEQKKPKKSIWETWRRAG